MSNEPTAAPLALLRELRDEFGSAVQNSHIPKFANLLTRIDAALAASGPEMRRVQRRETPQPTRWFSAVERREEDKLDRRQSAPRPDWIAQVIRDVSELPDRNSPDDAPELMLVAPQELRAIIELLAPRPDKGDCNGR